jgi:hypothetical protein
MVTLDDLRRDLDGLRFIIVSEVEHAVSEGRLHRTAAHVVQAVAVRDANNQTNGVQCPVRADRVQVALAQGQFPVVYFPKLGHAPDERKDYNDLEYNTLAPEAGERIAAELGAWFAVD